MVEIVKKILQIDLKSSTLLKYFNESLIKKSIAFQSDCWKVIKIVGKS